MMTSISAGSTGIPRRAPSPDKYAWCPARCQRFSGDSDRTLMSPEAPDALRWMESG
ncbi:hypothetical protein ACFL5H_01540 [Candidatus Latescibacterota bacterium]